MLVPRACGQAAGRPGPAPHAGVGLLRFRVMRICVLATETLHHAYFVKALAARGHELLALIEGKSAVPPYDTAHPFEAERDAHERAVWFGGAGRDGAGPLREPAFRRRERRGRGLPRCGGGAAAAQLRRHLRRRLPEQSDDRGTGAGGSRDPGDLLRHLGLHRVQPHVLGRPHRMGRRAGAGRAAAPALARGGGLRGPGREAGAARRHPPQRQERPAHRHGRAGHGHPAPARAAGDLGLRRSPGHQDVLGPGPRARRPSALHRGRTFPQPRDSRLPVRGGAGARAGPVARPPARQGGHRVAALLLSRGAGALLFGRGHRGPEGAGRRRLPDGENDAATDLFHLRRIMAV